MKIWNVYNFKNNKNEVYPEGDNYDGLQEGLNGLSKMGLTVEKIELGEEYSTVVAWKNSENL